MSRSSEAMSEHSLLIHLELGDNEAYPSGYEYVSDDRPGSKRESSVDSPSEGEGEANPSRCSYRKVVLPRIWSVNDFPVSMKNKVFNGLRPRF